MTAQITKQPGQALSVRLAACVLSWVLPLLLGLATPRAADFGNLVIVGDSITHGGGGYSSYRYQLFSHLETMQADYTFVGSNTGYYNGGTATTPDVGGVPFSNVHEGHWSWRASWMSGRLPLPTSMTAGGRGAGTVENWTGQTNQYALDTAGNLVTYSGTTYTPDTVVMLIGINDLNAGGTTGQLLADVESMVGQYQAANPAATIYLASVLPVGTAFGNYATLSTAVPEYNGLLAAAARGWSTTGSSVRFVDIATGFNANSGSMTYDNLHPNATGEAFIANRLSSTLLATQGQFDGTAIHVRNHSFEAPSGTGLSGTVDHWTFAGFGTDPSAGSFSPAQTSPGVFYSSPTGVDGNRVVYMLRGTEFGYAEQTLLGPDGVAGGGDDSVLAPNSLYTVTVAFGRRNGSNTDPWAGYQISMLAGDALVANKTVAGGAKGGVEEQSIGPAGAFTDHAWSFTTTDDPAGYGDQLKLRIGRNAQAGSTGRYLDFDNVRVSVMSDVFTWDSAATNSAWSTAANWSGAVPGGTGAAAPATADVAYFAGISSAVAASGIGIDMGGNGGAVNVAAVWVAGGSDTVRIGNSAAGTSGSLRLDGRTINGVANTVLAATGGADLTIADTPAGSGDQTMGVVLGGSSNVVQAAAGRTVTVLSDLGEAAAGASLAKTGPGLLLLSGTNTFTGPTAVSAGTVSITGTGSLPGWDTADRFSVASGATLAVGNAVADGDVTTMLGTGNFTAGSLLGFDTAAGDRTLAAEISGQIGLAKLSGNTFTLSASNPYTGPTAVSGGTLALSGAGDLASSSGVTLAAAGTRFDITAAGGNRTIAGLSGVAGSTVALGANTLTVNASAAGTHSGVISGTGSLVKAGTATLTLAGANTFSGGVRLEAGILEAGDNTAFGTGTLTLAGGSVRPAAALVIGNAISAATGTTSGLIDGGSGDLLYTGAATGNGTLAANSAVSRSMWLQGDWSGFTGQMQFTVNTGGTNYRLGGTPGSATVNSGTNSSDFSLATVVLAGTGTDRGLSWNGLQGATIRIGTLSGGGGRIIDGSSSRSAIWEVGSLNADSTAGVVITGTNALTKVGTGTLTLTGVSTYTGATTVTAGTLAFGAGGSTSASSPVTVQNGGTLRFDRTDAWGNSGVATTPVLTINAGGTVRSNTTYTTFVNPVFNGGTLEANGGANANNPTFGLKGTVAVNATAGGSQITTSGSGSFNTVAIGTGSAGGSTTFNVADGAATADLTVAAPLTNLGGNTSNLVKSGAGTMAFAAGSRYTGTTTINAGTLSIGTGGSLYFTGSFFGGTGATNVFVNTGATLETRNWHYGDGNALNQLRANSYSVRIDGGTVRFSESFNSVRGFQVGASGGTLEVPAGVTYSKDLGTAAGENLITGQGTGGGGRLTLAGAGTGTIQDPLGSTGTWSAAAGVTKTGTGTWTLAATNVYTGATTVSGGTLAGTAAGAFGRGTTSVASGATLQVAHAQALRDTVLDRPAGGGTVDFAAGTATYAIGGLTGPANLDAGASTLAIGGTNASTTYGGNLTAAALEKVGTGTFTLTNTSHALGGVTVAGGTLVAVNAASLGTGPVTLAGGRLRYTADTIISNQVVLSGAAATNAIDLGLPVDYLVVGGGGGGAGRDSGGGGGAGGVLSNLIGRGDALVATGSINVTVGGGGNGGVDGAKGTNGGNSAFGSLVALGGGAGSPYNGTPNSGGSGGGGGREGSGVTGGAGTAGPPLQGFNGGNGSNGTSGTADSGGGGGGAGAVGGNAVKSSRGGNGGSGVPVPIITTAEATSLSIGQVSSGEVFFGGGGGGAPHRDASSLTSGTGGVGGGGAAAPRNSSAINPGLPNTGGGGGASRSATAGQLTGGAGGSGVVVVRYLGEPVATGGTVTAGTGNSAGYTIHTFKTVGSSATFSYTPTRTISGNITGTGGFTFNTPASTLVLSGSGNTFSGGAVVSVGTLRGASAGAFGTGVATASGGTLEVAHVNALRDATLDAAGGTVAFTAAGTNTYAVAALSGAGAINAGGNSLAVGGGNANVSFPGSLTAATLVKQGTGTLTLSGANTLTDTRIEAGSVFAKSATAFGSGTVTLAGGGLRVAPGTSITNAIILDGAAGSNVLGSAVELDYLVVGGGGGGGGRDASGGGGAGGVLSSLVSAGLSPILGQVGDTFPVTVGGGGAGGGVSSSGGAVGQGTNGNPSSFATVTALGGGGGGAYNTGGKDGASGGGGGRGGNGGTGTAGQGFSGGNGNGTTNNNTGAGGGGAGAVGGNGTLSLPAGSGGTGLAVPIVSATLAADLAIGQVSGADVFFGGGGGGTPHRGATTLASGSGGLGGGGAGSVNATASFPTAGTANTGGGGGASRTDDATRGIGGAGGSGVVVVRYAGEQAFTGGSDIRTVDGFTYHTFKTVGSSSLQYLGGSATVSSSIGGTGGFTWSSAGTLTLSGSNSFQGGAIISAGTLVAASSSALGTGTATVASGARLRLDPAAILSNPIANLGTGSFLGSLDFAGGGLARTSTAGGTTLGTLLAGSAGSAASLNPAISWLAQTSGTSSDIMRLTNTAGTAQVLSLTYDPLLAPASPQEAYLGWFDTGPTNNWVNAIDGNAGGTGSFFQGSWTAYLAANPGATPSTALGAYGHDSATNSVWAVVNHNSDFAVIIVPEPASLALAGLGLAGLAALLRRRRATPAI